MDVLVAYDIADTDGVGAVRLRRIARVCEKYGQRVQFSVFECRLSPERLARLIGEVQDVIDSGCDSVMVYRFSRPNRRRQNADWAETGPRGRRSLDTLSPANLR